MFVILRGCQRPQAQRQSVDPADSGRFLEFLLCLSGAGWQPLLLIRTTGNGT